MLHKKYLPSFLFLFVLFGIMGTQSPLYAAPTITNPNEAMEAAQSLYPKTLEKKTDELIPTIAALDTYLQSSDLETSRKEKITKRLADMNEFLSSTSSPSTTTLMAFLRDTNKVARDFTEYAYSKKSYPLPQEIFTMQYGAQRMHIDILGGKLRSARSNGFEETRDAWTTIRENVSDTSVQQSVDTTLASLETAFEKNDAKAIYDGGASILLAIPQIEASYKEPMQVPAIIKTIKNVPKTVGFIGASLVFLIVGYFVFRRRRLN